MLQDLDSLAARIGQMVQFTRQLQDERTALLARLKNLEQERDALRDNLQRREAEYSTVADRMAEHEMQIKTLQTEAEATQAGLQVDVARYQAECESVRQRLTASQSDAARLREVADSARSQIDSILVRLPGAPRE